MKKVAAKKSTAKKHTVKTDAIQKSRRIIVYIATSADGFIARPDGSVDWLDRPHPKDHYGMPAFFKSIDTILWGRKTFMPVIEKGMDLSVYGAGIKHYIFSRSPAPQKTFGPGVEFVNEPIKPFAQRLRSQPAAAGKPGKKIMMMGGAELIAAFLDEGEIDEFSIHVIPVLIGEGIPLVAPRHRNVQLALLSTKTFPDGVVHLNYRVM
jgi:dihydrofolate reductase